MKKAIVLLAVLALLLGTAVPSDVPGARLNERVTTGNWL